MKRDGEKSRSKWDRCELQCVVALFWSALFIRGAFIGILRFQFLMINLKIPKSRWNRCYNYPRKTIRKGNFGPRTSCETTPADMGSTLMDSNNSVSSFQYEVVTLVKLQIGRQHNYNSSHYGRRTRWCRWTGTYDCRCFYFAVRCCQTHVIALANQSSWTR